MSGKIEYISGPVVKADLPGARLYELVKAEFEFRPAVKPGEEVQALILHRLLLHIAHFRTH